MDDGSQESSESDSKRVSDKKQIDWHEVWLAKRKRYRQNIKDAKQAFATKEEYMSSDLYKKSRQKDAVRQRWREVDTTEPDKFFYPPAVCFDLSYDDDIPYQDLRSLASQMMHAYGMLRKSERPLKWYITSLMGKPLEALQRLSGFDIWKVLKYERSYYEVFDKSKIVYLSPDATEVLDKVDMEAVYIIGGIVDDNKLTNLSLSRAEAQGVRAMRLPILEYAPKYVNLSLCVNQVYGILQDVAETGNWTESIKRNAPSRFKKETRDAIAAKKADDRAAKFKRQARVPKPPPDTSAESVAAILLTKEKEGNGTLAGIEAEESGLNF